MRQNRRDDLYGFIFVYSHAASIRRTRQKFFGVWGLSFKKVAKNFIFTHSRVASIRRAL